jgi:hypothetical protein
LQIASQVVAGRDKIAAVFSLSLAGTLVMSRLSLAVACLAVAMTVPSLVGAEDRLAPREAAAEVGKQLAAEIPNPDVVGVCDDEIFLRRATLDLVGRHPTVDEIAAFRRDSSTDKRAQLVAKLLDNKAFGENWSRYWHDVIMYRRSEEQARVATPALLSYLTEEFNSNTAWDSIASSFVTASGSVTENGATALFMAQNGRSEETASEIARIFMGIQIQCAQCHDHPTDRWQREQFHQLAAFLPRVAVRRNRESERLTFDVLANDRNARGARPGANNRFGGGGEHYMPDLDNPSARGKLTTPVFFATGQTLRLGTADADRRGALARWMTSPRNEWFAKAFVNRMWSELVGEGFYEPVDDMGPDRECFAPKTLDLLSQQFVASGHDIKWLFATIMATDAYQRQSASRRKPDEQPFGANVAQRLRADQLYTNIVSAIGGGGAGTARGGRGAGVAGFGGRNQRNPITAVFGYDPSERRDEIAGSIPQALAMMNSPLVNDGINGRGRTTLARLLASFRDDRALVTELYLRTLARSPTESEVTTSLQYIEQVGNRVEAFEDLQWALVNSTEFLHRR